MIGSAILIFHVLQNPDDDTASGAPIATILLTHFAKDFNSYVTKDV